jgi:hypothetical protein
VALSVVTPRVQPDSAHPDLAGQQSATYTTLRVGTSQEGDRHSFTSPKSRRRNKSSRLVVRVPAAYDVVRGRNLCFLRCSSYPPLSRPKPEQGTGARPDTKLEAEVTGSLTYASHDASVHASQMMPRAECRPVYQVIRAAIRPEHDVVVVQVHERRAARHRAAPPVTLEHPMRCRQSPTIPTPDIDYMVEHRFERLALGG